MRQVKAFPVSPIEQELSFLRWCRENKIKTVLVDGDDTLWETVPIFQSQMEKCYDILAQVGPHSRAVWTIKVNEINDQMFEAYGVNPNRWDLVVGQLVSDGLDLQTSLSVRETLAQIYKIPPVFIKGTELGLSFLKKIGIPLGIVTHANVEWTRMKFDTLGLDRFMSWEDIYIVDENGHKTKKSWQAAMDFFKVRPENCLVVGDSPRSDINPVTELGVRHSFLVQNNYSLWSAHQQPIDETKTRGIKSIGDLRYLGREIVHQKSSSISSQY